MFRRDLRQKAEHIERLKVDETREIKDRVLLKKTADIRWYLTRG